MTRYRILDPNGEDHGWKGDQARYGPDGRFVGTRADPDASREAAERVLDKPGVYREGRWLTWREAGYTIEAVEESADTH